MLPLKTLVLRLLVGFTIVAILASCASTRPMAEDLVSSEPLTTAALDSAGNLPALDVVTVRPARGLLATLLDRPARAQRYARPAGSAAPLVGRIGKHATVTVNQGVGQVTTTTTQTGKKGQTLGEHATSVTKPKAPVSTGAGDAVSQPRATNAAAVHGNDNALVLATTPKPTGWARARPWVIGGACLVGVVLLWRYWALVEGFFTLLFSLFKRKQSTDNPS